jgi:RNA polymerase sigma-70 factor (ECF subfamily)
MDINPQLQPIDWEQVYSQELPRVYNFFLYRVGDEPLAEDLTAATFEKAWKYRERYRSDLAAFSTWLFTMARNVSADHFRQQRPQVALNEAALGADERPVEETIQRQGDFARLRALMERLEARERELIALKYGAGLTNRAVAELTGLSESNVGTILHRIVTRMRLEWEEITS